ncbi:MAG: putative Prolyl oligopeptidase MEROPS family S09A [Candidatus Thorarchaeota archaeon]|nr:MAG: putative Prolyl oligopeptidase MEROPS family S09A [Candidatus Thorarchaeota archaeon]
MEGTEYPKTRVDEVVETIHGVEVRDPYRWLENKDDPEVQDWIKRQMEFSKSIFESFGDQEPIKERLRELSLFDSISSKPAVIRITNQDMRLFYLFRYKDDSQMRLCYQDGIEGKRVTLIDPNSLDSEGLTRLSCFFPSPDGKFVVCGFSVGGSDKNRIQIISVDTKKFLNDEFIEHVSPSIVWLSDSKGFYYVYNSFQSEENGISRGSIFYHELNSSISDPCIHSPKNRPFEITTLIGCFNQDRLIFTRTRATASDCLILSLRVHEKSDNYLLSIIENSPKLKARLRNNLLYILTQKSASKGKILSFDLKTIDEIDTSRPNIVLEEREHSIEDFIPLDDFLIFIESQNAKSIMFRLKFSSNQIIPIFGKKEIVRVSSLSSCENNNYLFFVTSSFHHPFEQWVYNPARGLSKIFSPNVALEPRKFISKQVWFQSHDGTKVPMFLLHKRNLDLSKSCPVLLFGYGGFGESHNPGYSPLHVVWNEIDGIYAVVGLRGGGEFGKEWHFDGIREKKQNTIEDLIHAASWFIENKIALNEQVGIRGSSNGGLVVLSAMVQKPYLFCSVFAGSPLADMIRFIIQPLSKYWIPEYGNPQEPDDFEFLISYSPYHNVRDRMYPSTLVHLAENDTRVDHMHAMKMLAKLQSFNYSVSNPFLLWFQKSAGHEGGMPMEQWIDFWSLELIFHLSNYKINISKRLTLLNRSSCNVSI